MYNEPGCRSTSGGLAWNNMTARACAYSLRCGRMLQAGSPEALLYGSVTWRLRKVEYNKIKQVRYSLLFDASTGEKRRRERDDHTYLKTTCL